MVVATRPAGLTDLCLLEPTADPMAGDCAAELPIHSSPRLVAGAPRINDILKCVLRPIDLEDYAVSVDDAELARLDAAFPERVCGRDATGVEQVPELGTWQSFGPKS